MTTIENLLKKRKKYYKDNRSKRDVDILLDKNEALLIRKWSLIVKASGTKGVIKGGFVRDKIASQCLGFNIAPKDIDIFVMNNINMVVSNALKNGARLIEQRTRKNTLVFKFQDSDIDSQIIELGVLMAPSNIYDLQSFRELKYYDAINSDLDVNSMSVELGENFRKVYDPLNAIISIKKRNIKIVKIDSMVTSPEIIFRAFRVADKLRCSIDPILKKEIEKYAKESVEKMKRPYLDSQLIPIINSPNSEKNWALMKNMGVVEHFIKYGVNDLNDAVRIFIKNES